MSRYRAYAEYKDSGVEWFDTTPKHWEIKRISYVAQLRSGDAIVAEQIEIEGDYPVFGGNGLRGYTSEFNHTGDYILIGRQGALCGNINYGSGDFWASEHAVVVHPFLPVSIKWFGELLRAMNLNQYNVSAAQPGLAVANITCLKIPFPPKNEQETIANFLDHETAKIDTLIAKQQQLIKLLKEKRQAVISHAVTKGLNPNAPMRDSGVEWLGEVPEHWLVTRAKFLFDFITSGSRGWAEYYSDDGELFFRITNLTRDTIEPKLESIQYVSPPIGSEGERSRIQLNDLLISITADLGSVCVANKSVENGYVSQHIALCRPNKAIAPPRWLGFFILSDMAKEQFIGSGYGGTKVQLSLEDIRALWVVLPKPEEQIDIARFVERKMTQFGDLMLSADAQIRLLQERRTALISAAVTGKIDVRDWQTASTFTPLEAAA